MKFNSLRVRLTLWILVLLCLIQLTVSAIIYVASSQWLLYQVDRSLFVTATQVATVISEDRDPLEQGDINFQFDEGGVATRAFLNEQQFFVRLLDMNTGQIIETSAVNDVPVTSSIQHTDYETFQSGQTSIRVYTVALQQNQQFAVQIGISLSGMQETQGQILYLLTIAFGITAIFAVLSGWFVGTRASLPIQSITRTAQEITAQDLSQRLDIQSSDEELQQLMQTFNDMLDRLQGAFQQQRQFTADAAHELRTPLSIMQTGLDVTLSQQRSVSEYQTSLESVREEVQRLTQLANALLVLARSDTHELSLNIEKYDLSTLLETVIEQLTVVAEEKRIQIERNIQPNLLLYGDEDRMIQIALNLIENAIKYAPKDGKIRIDATKNDQLIQFTVHNSGTTIRREELEHIFDRFYRADEARNRQQGGFGLGLAITKQLIELHGGTIQVESNQLGIIFEVCFPIQSSK